MAKQNKGPKLKPILERFNSKVVRGEHEDDCWTWTGETNHQRYGLLRLERRPDGRRRFVVAHRFSFEFFWQEEIGDYHILHSCHNTCCVNPAHLRLGTPKENSRDMYEAGRNPDFKGEKHPKAILSYDQVREIRRRWENHRFRVKDGNSSPEMAKEFGVSLNTIIHVVTNRNWKGV